MQITSDMIAEGKMRMNYDETTQECNLQLAVELTDGTQIAANAAAVSEAPEAGNTITVDGTTEPVRASFYLDDGEGNVYLYFTSAELTHFGEIENAADYFTIVLNEDDLTGNAFDITATNKLFTIFYVNQVTGDTQAIDNNADYGLNGATGTVSVSRDGSDPTQFTADIDLTFGDGTTIQVDFNGPCLSVDYVPEVPNEFTVFGATESIKSILVDQRDPEIWHIYLTATPGLETVQDFIDDWAFHITAPAEAFNGVGVGFSTYKETLKFEYDGNTWCWLDDGTAKGSLTVSLDGNQLELEFTTYGDVTGQYSGPAIVVTE